MNFIKAQLDQEYNSIGIKKLKPKVIHATKRQVGKRQNINKDKKRKALPPGLRISKSGKKYYEYRKDRTDIPGLGI